MSLGFTFNNVHSRDMGVVFQSSDRTLLPPKRVVQYTIPGKSGTYDIDDGYDNREITLNVAFAGEAYNYPACVRVRERSPSGSQAKACSYSTTSRKEAIRRRLSPASASSKSPSPGIAKLSSRARPSPKASSTGSKTRRASHFPIPNRSKSSAHRKRTV